MTDGFTVWFTGLPNSGKMTLAQLLAARLRSLNFPVELLDGDEVRRHLSQELGYSRQGRDLNISRIGFVCHLLSRNGVIAIAAAISPYREARAGEATPVTEGGSGAGRKNDGPPGRFQAEA